MQLPRLKHHNPIANAHHAGQIIAFRFLLDYSVLVLYSIKVVYPKYIGLYISDFLGYSGHVVIDDVAGREPNFVVRAFDKNMKLIIVAEAQMYKPDGQVSRFCLTIRQKF